MFTAIQARARHLNNTRTYHCVPLRPHQAERLTVLLRLRQLQQHGLVVADLRGVHIVARVEPQPSQLVLFVTVLQV